MAGQSFAVRLIGPFAVETPHGTLTQDALPGRVSVLLKLLALAPDHSLHREEVVETLWPGSEPERGRNNLHKALHALRRAAPSMNGSQLVSLNSAMVTLDPGVVVDLDEFQTAAAEAQTRGTADLLYALELASGELLPADIYEDWATVHRDRYRATVVGLRYSLASQHARAGRVRQAETQLRAILDADPFDERAHRELMRRFHEVGDTRSALQQYEACATSLSELGATPSRETTDLLDEITAEATPYAPLREKPCPHIYSTYADDQVRVAYHTLGKGFPLVHLASLPWSNLELEWQVPAWRTWYERLAEDRMLVRYDGRGQGVADRRDVTATLATTTSDLSAVVDTLGLEQFDVYAPIHASMTAIAYAAAHPERVHRMVLFNPYSEGCEFLDQGYVRSGAELAQNDWYLFCQYLVSNAFAMGREEVVRAVTSVFVSSSSPEHMAAVVSGYLTESVVDLYERVMAPVLVLEPRLNAPLPAGVIERVAHALPRGELLSLPDVALIPIIGAVDLVIRSIHTFLDAPD